ncbi:XRE family transcriptional regulator [Achromobacter piechaudii]|uniref:transcriptional regulator n=1 Tax=Achromobacter piechaudii TaxID=72556 RepID=UPI0006A455C1|nr:YdaS family helix-turn-helix protein [Achromobacter piechaudii]KNY09405.1 XRE family transcriptional regulator [Achromobacter piechaudii]
MDLKTYISTSPRGTAASLAKAIGVSPSYLSQMASGQSPISPERCVAIERATGAVVRRRDLWPDGWDRVWPELKEAAHGQQ